MADKFTSQVTWAAGELSPRLWYRKDLEQNSAGAKGLKNCFVWRQGGLFRRPGTIFRAVLPGDGIIVDFVYSSAIAYTLVLTDKLAAVYRKGFKVHEFVTPWAFADLAKLYWTQSYDVLFVTHPDYVTQVIKRFADDDWTIEDFAFFTDAGWLEQPYWKFADTNTSLNPSGTTGTITLTASDDLFDDLHVGTRFRLRNGEVTITAVTDTLTATATIDNALNSSSSTKDWEEQAFSAYRGYPTTVEIHEQRLAFSGTRSLPNTTWLSESGDLYSFKPKDRASGDVLAENAITFTVDANPGQTVFLLSVSNRLMVGTTDGEDALEAAATSDGLGPDNILIRNGSNWGSQKGRVAVVVGADIMHIQRGGRTIRQLGYHFQDDKIDSAIITDVSEHLITGGAELLFQSTPEQALWLRNEDETVVRMTYEPDQKVAAWTPVDIGGPVSSIAVVPEPDGTDAVYFIVQREGQFFFEELSEQSADPLVTSYLDSSVYGHDEDGKSVWGGLSHLEDQMVEVWADGFRHPPVQVADGQITLLNAYNSVWAGLPYEHEIDFLPPNRDELSQKAQLHHLLLYLLETKGQNFEISSGEFTDTYAIAEEAWTGLLELPWQGRTERDLGTITARSSDPFSFGLIGATFIWSTHDE